MRLAQKHIKRDIIINAIDSYEIIEAYPEDKYLPSYLLYGYSGRIAFHVLVAVDKININIRVITAYLPDKNEWEDNLRVRRKTK